MLKISGHSMVGEVKGFERSCGGAWDTHRGFYIYAIPVIIASETIRFNSTP